MDNAPFSHPAVCIILKDPGASLPKHARLYPLCPYLQYNVLNCEK